MEAMMPSVQMELPEVCLDDLEVGVMLEQLDWQIDDGAGYMVATAKCGTGRSCGTNAGCAASIVPTSCGNTTYGMAMCIPCLP